MDFRCAIHPGDILCRGIWPIIILLHYLSILPQTGESSDELLLILGSGVRLEVLISSFVVQHLLHLRLISFCVHNHCSFSLVGRKEGWLWIAMFQLFHYWIIGRKLNLILKLEVATLNEQRLRISNCSLLLIYLPRKDKRLSRPGWLTCSGRFTHISGYPSAAGRARDRESSPVKDRRSTNCATQPTEITWSHVWLSW